MNRDFVGVWNMYEVYVFFVEGEVIRVMELEYEVGECYVLIVFCCCFCYSVYDFKLVEEIVWCFGWEDVQVFYGGVLQLEFFNGDFCDFQESFIEVLYKGGVVVLLNDWLMCVFYVC